VIAAAHEMGRLIDALLSLSRVGRSDFRREPVDLSELARTVWAGLASTEAGAATEVEVQPGLVAGGDGRLLRILLTNLLGNAWKFTRKTPSPRIEFSAGVSGSQQAYFVRDNGAGFDPTAP
jgi:signal transduction histidine kinase